MQELCTHNVVIMLASLLHEFENTEKYKENEQEQNCVAFLRSFTFITFHGLPIKKNTVFIGVGS